MDEQYSQGGLADFDVVRSTQFDHDLSRQVHVYGPSDFELADPNAVPLCNMENV